MIRVLIAAAVLMAAAALTYPAFTRLTPPSSPPSPCRRHPE